MAADFLSALPECHRRATAALVGGDQLRLARTSS
jgi:hypothetical protein